MAVTAVDSSFAASETPEAKFNAALDKAAADPEPDPIDDPKFSDALVTNAVTIGGQFIIMPMAQNILNDAQSDDDDE
jgi:hypothetical protein